MIPNIKYDHLVYFSPAHCCLYIVGM